MLRAGIIGCGRIAGGYDCEVPTEWTFTHAGAYHLCPETTLVAVADTDTAALSAFQEKWGVKGAYRSYDEMLRKEVLDVVSICLPTEHHLDAFRAVAESNVRGVFCEKPLSYQLEESERICSLGKYTVVSVNYFRRWNPTFEELAASVQRGDYGKALSIVIRYTKGIFVNASHFMDFMRWLYGEPQEIIFLRCSHDDAVDPGMDFTLTFENGMTAYFIHCDIHDYVFADIDMVMEKGRIVIAQRGQVMTIYSPIPEPHYQLFDILSEANTVETQWRLCMSRGLEELVRCIHSGGIPACSLHDGHRVVEICATLMEAYRKKSR